MADAGADGFDAARFERNGVVLFEDTGELLPDGSTIAPHRGPAPHTLIAA